MHKRVQLFGGLLFVWVLLMVQGSEAQPVVFDFEDQDIQEGLTSLEVTAEDITMALSRPGDTFGITDIVGGAFGERSLSPFFPGTTQNRPFIANFSEAVSRVSIDAGDFVYSDLDTLSLQAFSGPGATGTLLATVQVDCCQTGQGFVFATVTVEASGIRSVQFIGGSTSNPNSVFYDNITVTPEVADSDDDGYPNDTDACQQSDLYDTVVVDGIDSGSHNALHANGCTTADEVTACAEDATNHGNFVSCVSRVTQVLKKDGYLTDKEAQAILSCAAQAPLP